MDNEAFSKGAFNNFVDRILTTYPPGVEILYYLLPFLHMTKWGLSMYLFFSTYLVIECPLTFPMLFFVTVWETKNYFQQKLFE